MSSIVFENEDGYYCSIVFGTGSLFNHMNDRSDIVHYSVKADYHHNSTAAESLAYPYTSHKPMEYYTGDSIDRTIAPGSELFVSYGSDNWFLNRNFTVTYYEPDELEQVYCRIY